MKYSNKETRLMRYLQEFGSITSMDAISELGDTRLAATVFLLRKKGVDIISTNETNVNRWDEKVTYVRYILQEEKSNDKQTVA